MASRAEWTGRVARWEASGLSATAFAGRERLDPKRLVWWRWKLRTSSPPTPPTPPRPSPLDFLPVRVVEAAPAAVSAPPIAVSPIEIVLPNGRVVRVPSGVDEAELERVLAIASGVAAC